MKQPKKTKIKIKNNQKKITINKKRIDSCAQRVLEIKRAPDAELGILFVGIRRIRTLNRKFRKIDLPTDVLAFSMREGGGTRLHREILGDVVICPEVAKKYARIYGTSLSEEICLDLVHGILHLFGYQDSSTKSRTLMESEQQRILRRLNTEK